MFNRRTVFIVGAGCSAELDLPLGPQLLGRMRGTLGDSKTDLFNQVHDAFVRCGLPDAHMNVERRINLFRDGLDAAPSIDQYLDFHQSDPTMVMLGKCCLAAEILNAEAESPLREENAFNPLPDIWLRQLFYLLMNGLRREQSGQLFHNVSFICFNYDRVIQLFLKRALISLTHCSMQEANELLRNLKVWHPYGSVGKTDLGSGGISTTKAAFSSGRIDWTHVLEAAKSLRTFTEGACDASERDEMRQALVEAQQIVFLGFSYLEQNMRLLSLAPKATAAGPIYGTTFKMPDPVVEIARRSIIDSLGPVDDPNRIEHRVKLHGLPARQFISDFGAALRR
jgi:hypothetical protein